VDESTGGSSGGAARVGEVGEGGSDGSVRGASGPWGQPRGLMEMRAIRQVAGAPTGPVTTVMRRSSSSSSLPSSSPCWLDDEGPWAGATRLGQPQPWMTHGLPLRHHREASGSEGSIGQ
jgi:hypothetical protein